MGVFETISWAVKVYDICTDVIMIYQVHTFPRQLDEWGASDDGTCGDDPCGRGNMPILYYVILFAIVIFTITGIIVVLKEWKNDCTGRRETAYTRLERYKLKKWGLFFEDVPQLVLAGEILLSLDYWKDHAKMNSSDSSNGMDIDDDLVQDGSFAAEWEFACSPQCDDDVLEYYKGLLTSLLFSVVGTVASILTVLYLWYDVTRGKSNPKRQGLLGGGR